MTTTRRVFAHVVVVEVEEEAVTEDSFEYGEIALIEGYSDARQGLGRGRVPHVLADQDPQADATERYRLGQGPGGEQANLGEYAGVGQGMLVTHRRYRAAVQQQGAVVGRPLLPPRRADKERRAAVGGGGGELGDPGLDTALKGALENQVLGRIAAKRQLAALLGVYERDNSSAWDCGPDGVYVRRTPAKNEKRRSAQETFMELARRGSPARKRRASRPRAR